MLQVGVKRNHVSAPAEVERTDNCAVSAKILKQANGPDPGIIPLQLQYYRPGVVGAVIVDKDNLKAITGQAPQMILSKQAISNFKLREDMPAMLRVTLREEKAYDFINRVVTLVLPRVRDFNGLSTRKFDGQGNYNIGFPTQTVFPEIMPESITTPMGLQININTTTSDDTEAQALLSEL